MKSSLLYLSLLAIFVGGGCAKQPPFAPLAIERVSTSLCSTPPQETESGALAYPIAPEYRHLPHLGQIYTAIDCNNRERALQVRGFKDGFYTQGIRLRWEEGKPTRELESFLRQLGFERKNELSDPEETWMKREGISLEQLLLLQLFLKDPKETGGTVSEDCILCG